MCFQSSGEILTPVSICTCRRDTGQISLCYVNIIDQDTVWTDFEKYMHLIRIVAIIQILTDFNLGTLILNLAIFTTIIDFNLLKTFIIQNNWKVMIFNVWI